jgi:hypothetical protein
MLRGVYDGMQILGFASTPAARATASATRQSEKRGFGHDIEHDL